MAARAQAVEIDFRAKLGQFKKSLGDIPGLTKKAARQMTKEWIAEQREIRKSARDTARAVDKAWKGAGNGLRSTLASVVPGFDRFEDTLERVDTVLGSGSGGARKMAMAIGGLAVAGVVAAGVARLGVEVEATRGKIVEMSQVTNLQLDTLAALDLALAGDRDALNAYSGALGTFNERMVKADQGSMRALRSFGALGIEVRNAEGELRSTDDVLREVIGKLQDLGPGAASAGLGTQLLGDKARDLLATLGDTRIEEWVELSERFGLSMEESADATADWGTALGNLKIAARDAIDDLVTSFTGTKLAKALDNVTLGFVYVRKFTGTILSEWAGNVSTIAGEAWKAITFQDVDREALTVAVAEVTQGYRSMARAAAEAYDEAEAFAKLQAARRAAARAAGAEGPGVGTGSTGATSTKKKTGERQGLKDALDGAKSAQSAAEQLAGMVDGLWLSTSSGLEEINLRYAQQVAQIGDLAEKSGDLILANEALALAEVERQQTTVDFYEAEAEAAEKARKERQAEHEEELARLRELGAARGDLARSAVGFAMDIADAALRQQDRETSGGRKAARILFGIRQAFALSDIGIRTQQAIMAALTVPPPVGPIAAAAAGLQGATSAAIVASQKPPTSHTGGVVDRASSPPPFAPDEVQRTLQAGEGVLTTGAVASIGGPSAVDAINAGAGMGPVVNVIQLGSRVLETAVEHTMARPSAAVRRAARGYAARPVGHGRR